MKINFRQGIVTHPVAGVNQSFLVKHGNHVDLDTSNGLVTVTFAHGGTNYLYIENVPIDYAWTNVTDNCYLYWDLDKITGTRTFGYTVPPPQYGIIYPTNPTNDQHFFDLNKNKSYRYEGSQNRWIEVIRVFAAYYNGVTFTSLTSGYLGMGFAGSQINTVAQINAGLLLFQEDGKPVRNFRGEFITTETVFFSKGSRVNTSKLENDILPIIAGETIPEFHVVKLMADGKWRLAGYNDTESTIIAFTPYSVLFGDISSANIEGVFSNPYWHWITDPATNVNYGDPLWISTAGQLTAIDPNLTDNLTYPDSKRPVARVLDDTTIVFGLNPPAEFNTYNVEGLLLSVKENGALVSNNVTSLNFVGIDPVTDVTGNTATITLPDSTIAVNKDGAPVNSNVKTFNFIGDNITVSSVSGDTIDLNVIDQSSLNVQDEGVTVAPAVKFLNFTGSVVTSTSTGPDSVTVDINVPPSGITVKTEGGNPGFIGSTTLNFTGNVDIIDEGNGQIEVNVPQSTITFTDSKFTYYAYSLTEMRALVPDTDNAVILFGAATSGDGADFKYYYDSDSAVADDGFDTIKPNTVSGNGRWKRLDAVKKNLVNVFTKQQATAQTNITSTAGNIVWDLNDAQTARFVLTEDATITVTNQIAGATYVLMLVQDGTGGHAITFGPSFKFADDFIPPIATDPTKMTLIAAYSDGTFLYCNDTSIYSTT